MNQDALLHVAVRLRRRRGAAIYHVPSGGFVVMVVIGILDANDAQVVLTHWVLSLRGLDSANDYTNAAPLHLPLCSHLSAPIYAQVPTYTRV